MRPLRMCRHATVCVALVILSRDEKAKYLRLLIKCVRRDLTSTRKSNRGR